jgi:hypothetical protein
MNSRNPFASCKEHTRLFMRSFRRLQRTRRSPLKPLPNLAQKCVKLLAFSSPQRSSKLLLTENENVSLLLKGAEIVKTASSVGGVNSNKRFHEMLRA